MHPNNAPSHQRWTDRFQQDRVVIFGGSDRTLDLLTLAVIRSDNVLLIAVQLTDEIARFARRFAVRHRSEPGEDSIASAATVLVAVDDVETAKTLTQQARAAGTPIHVAGHPLLSDFGILEFLERRSSTAMRKAQT